MGKPELSTHLILHYLAVSGQRPSISLKISSAQQNALVALSTELVYQFRFLFAMAVA